MDVSQFMSTKNAMAGAPKQSFKNFNTPGNFEERVSEVKEKVDKLLEYQENDIAFRDRSPPPKKSIDMFENKKM